MQSQLIGTRGNECRTQLRQEALRESRKALDLMAKSELTRDEQEAVVGDCVANFDKYVNPGILEYRKSVLDRLHGGRVARRGQRLLRHPRQGVHRLPRRLRHLHAGPPAPHRGQGGHGPARSTRRCTRRSCSTPCAATLSELLAHGHAGRPAVLLLLQLRHRGQRGRAEARQAATRRRKKANHTQRASSAPSSGFHGKSFGQPERERQGASGASPSTRCVPNVRFVPYGDADALDKELKVCDTIGFDIAAFIAEPVQGEAGRHRPAGRLLPQGARDLRQVGHPVHRRRGADGHGPHRHALGHRALGRRARHHDHGQGARRRRHPGRATSSPRPRSSSHVSRTRTSTRRRSAATRWRPRPPSAPCTPPSRRTSPGRPPRRAPSSRSRLEELRAQDPDLLRRGPRPRPADRPGVLQRRRSATPSATGLFGEGVLTGGTLFNAKTFRIEPPATLTQHEMDEVVARLERVMGRVRGAAARRGAGAAH